MTVFHRACTMLLLAMTACSSHNPHDAGSRPQRATMPPADYVHISSADVSNSKNIQIGVNTDLIDSDEADVALSLASTSRAQFGRPRPKISGQLATA